MTDLPFQDYYLDQLSHCYGCGRLNEHGLMFGLPDPLPSLWLPECLKPR